MLAAVRKERLTYLTDPQLTSLVSCVLEAEASGREGLVIEAGHCARGLCSCDGRGEVAGAADAGLRRVRHDPASRPSRTVPTARSGTSTSSPAAREDWASDVYYGYREDLLGEVAASFARHGVPVDEHRVELVQGLFQDTIKIDEPVALAHVDGDWYESTLTCLTRIAPHLVPGGRIVIDDYWSWSGCRTAVDEYVANHPELQMERRAKVHLVRR